MSRLEEIKRIFKAMNDLPSFKKLAPTETFFEDIDYLIQQAEQTERMQITKEATSYSPGSMLEEIVRLEKRVEVLEEQLDHRAGVIRWDANRFKEMNKQINRYKQALEEIVIAKEEYFGNEYPDAVDAIATKALEGDSNE